MSKADGIRNILPFYSREVFLDANLLLLLAVGLWNPRAIKTHKRVETFSVDDFLLLNEFVRGFERFVTTPHVLAEVSNLARGTSTNARDAILGSLARLTLEFDERYDPAVELCASPEFRLFGLTDAAISRATDKTLLLTQDGRLPAFLVRRGCSVLNLDQIRTIRSRRQQGFSAG